MKFVNEFRRKNMRILLANQTETRLGGPPANRSGAIAIQGRRLQRPAASFPELPENIQDRQGFEANNLTGLPGNVSTQDSPPETRG